LVRLAPSWQSIFGMLTRGAAHRAAEATQARIAELEAQLQQLSGREHKAGRSRVNKELWMLQNQPSAPIQQPAVALPVDDGAAPLTPEQQLLLHWLVLHPTSEAGPEHCVRCGAGSAPSCRFHPDAKAYAFGTGRFEFGYTSLWDTPHDRWFCCGGAAPDCPGCCEEAAHCTDPDWWRAYSHLAPPLEDDDCESSSESDGAEAMAAMDIT
jgi:hypothetical protein